MAVLATAVGIAGTDLMADVSAFDARIAADIEQADAEGLRWVDGLSIGLESKGFPKTKTPYGRLPVETFDRMPAGLRGMQAHATGHYLFFDTDSTTLAVEWTLQDKTKTDPFIPPQGMYGVDIYCREKGKPWRFVRNGRLAKPEEPVNRTCVNLPVGRKSILVYLPTRGVVTKMRVGVKDGSHILEAHHDSGIVKPIVHYGTSIVHGGCSSRPGLCFTSVAARLLDVPYVNLGFSGCAKLEPEVAETLVRAEASLYIVDPAWNCSPALVRERLEKFLRILHAAHPETPILVCEGGEPDGKRLPTNDAMLEVYRELVAGDQSLAEALHYLPAEGLIQTDGESTHDYCHPNDYGALQMGRVFAAEIGKTLGLRRDVHVPQKRGNEARQCKDMCVRMCVDEETGGIGEISISGDAAGMNWTQRGDGEEIPWVTSAYRWGTGTLKVNGEDRAWSKPVSIADGETVYRPAEGVEVHVRREPKDDGFDEAYEWRNVSEKPVALSEIDVHVPFNDNYLPRHEMWSRRCFAHVWAGGSSAWVCAMRMGGKAPHLGLAVTSGAVDAYELKLRDIKMGLSNYRGVIALSPPDVTLGPGESASVSWRLFPFADKADFFRRVRELGGVSVSVSDWTVTRREPVDVTFEWNGGKTTKHVIFEREGRVCVPFEYGAGKRTFAELNAIDDPFEHVLRRARFLVAHQQVNEPGSPYDGAFTQYDMETGLQRRWWEVGGSADHEPGAERLGIGVSLAVLAQHGYRDEFEKPLRRYADFVLKLCHPDGYVYASLSPKSRRRDFNSPWASEFFLEMYKLTGEMPYLEKAYEILLAVILRKGTLILVESPDAGLVKTLRKAGRETEARRLEDALVRSKELGLKVAKADERIEEVNFSPEFAASRILQLLAVFDFTGDRRFLDAVTDFLPAFEANLAPLPSAWCHDIGLHHWDGYWFGKRQCWGDTQPNHWNGTGADAFAELARHGIGADENRLRSRKIGRQVLTLIRPDGGAGCAFVYPDRVNGHPAKFLDPLANDQDWVVLYYLRNSWLPRM